jgi:hypothetical protein
MNAVSPVVPNSVICGRCPDVYSPEQIRAIHGDDEKTLAELQRMASTPAQKSRWSKQKKRVPREARTFAPANLTGAIEVLKDWTFKCPNDHEVDANAGPPLPLAVVGEPGASKTHFLPGLVYEMYDLNRLAKIGVRLRHTAYVNPTLETRKQRLYEFGERLPRTRGGSLDGPYGYKLVVRTEVDEGRKDLEYILQLFDVAGENFDTIVQIASNAKFIYLCRGFIVLLDPSGLVSTAFDMGEQTRAAAVRTQANVRKSIGVLADALEYVWRRPVKELGIPICFVVAKADSVDWGFDYRSQTEEVVARIAAGESPTAVLTEASTAAQDAFVAVGGDHVVDEILERFDENYVRFAAASATSEMPLRSEAEDPGAQGSETEAVGFSESGPRGARVWRDPEPAGISLTFLQVLNMLNAVRD